MYIHRSFVRSFQIVAAAALLSMAIANAGLAFIFPLELELREGTSWLYVLAAQSGISIYDHSRVAFLNMNHGPLDPLLKQGIAAVCPFLSPAMVTRFFVVLLPIGLLVAMLGTGIKKVEAVLWAMGVYIFLLGVQPPNFLIGRSDPAAMFALALLVWIAPIAGKSVSRATPYCLGWIVASGLLAAAVVLTNWRFFPAVAVVIAANALECALQITADRRPSLLLFYVGGIVLAGCMVFASVLTLVFHGDYALYYRHFFGFFSPENSWGAFRDAPFQVFPPALMASHWPIHLLSLAVVILGIFYPSTYLPRKIQLGVWIPLFAALWLASATAYYLNHSGGGIHYFGSFYVLLGYHMARAVEWRHLKISWLQEVVLIGLFCALPWSSTWQQVRRLEDSFRPAYTFLAETKRVATGTKVFSEDFYLFKDHYEGEEVDMGDIVFKANTTSYFGAEFDRTANRYFARLQSEPPRFVLTGGLGSPLLQDLLARSYRPILRVPADPTTYAGPAQTLYQLAKNQRPAP